MRDLLFREISRKIKGVELTSNEVEGGTGCFEVYALRNGEIKLVHSALRGDGRISRYNVQKVVKKIEELSD